MGKVFSQPQPGIVRDVPAFDLFEVLPGIEGQAERPRDAHPEEVRQYLLWVAARAGIVPPEDAYFGREGICHGNKVIVAMPGYGQSQTVTCELLDEAGAVIKTMPLPVDRRGKLPMNAAQVQDWTGLAKVRKPRATKAPRPPVQAPIPVEAPSEPEGDLRALVAGLAAQVANLTKSLAALPADNRAVDKSAPVSVPVAQGPDARDAYIAELTAERDAAREEAAQAGRERDTAQGIMRDALGELEAAQEAAAKFEGYWIAVSTSAAEICRERDALQHKRRATAARLAGSRRATRTVRRELIGMGAARAVAVAELERLRPVSDLIAAMAAAAAVPPAPAVRLAVSN